jgi:hypothetical protein
MAAEQGGDDETGRRALAEQALFLPRQPVNCNALPSKKEDLEFRLEGRFPRGRGARSPKRADAVPRTWFDSSLRSAEERAGEGRPGPNQAYLFNNFHDASASRLDNYRDVIHDCIPITRCHMILGWNIVQRYATRRQDCADAQLLTVSK